MNQIELAKQIATEAHQPNETYLDYILGVRESFGAALVKLMVIYILEQG